MTGTPGSYPDPNGPQGQLGPPPGYGNPPTAGEPEGYPAQAAQHGAGDPAGQPGQPGQPGHSEQTPAPAGFDDKGRVRRGRISATWVGIIAAVIILILLIIFIAQNQNKATIHFLGASGSLPLGLLILVAAIAGIVIAVIPGTIRILQLRKALKKNTPKDQRVHDQHNSRHGK